MVSDDRCGCSRFGQLHTLFPVPMPLICRPLACFATLPRYTVNKLTKLSRCDSYTIELLNNRTARLLVLLGIQAQTARIHLAPFGSTLLHLAQLGSTWLHLTPLGSTWLLLAPHGSTWIHLASIMSTWVHLCPPGSTFSPPGYTRVHLDPLGSTWVHFGPLGSTRVRKTMVAW